VETVDSVTCVALLMRLYSRVEFDNGPALFPTSPRRGKRRHDLQYLPLVIPCPSSLPPRNHVYVFCHRFVLVQYEWYIAAYTSRPDRSRQSGGRVKPKVIYATERSPSLALCALSCATPSHATSRYATSLARLPPGPVQLPVARWKMHLAPDLRLLLRVIARLDRRDSAVRMSDDRQASSQSRYRRADTDTEKTRVVVIVCRPGTYRRDRAARSVDAGDLREALGRYRDAQFGAGAWGLSA
jgi:hypothetical protein